FPKREKHAERKNEHEKTDADDQERLDGGAQVLEVIVHLALVVFGDFSHQLIDRTAFFADADHLQHERREHARRRRRARDGFAALHAVAHLQDALGDVFVVDRAADHRHALHQRHAGLHGHGHGTSEAPKCRAIKNAADDRNLEFGPMPAVPAFRRAHVNANGENADDQRREHQGPVGDRELRGGDENLRCPRQLGVHAGEDLGEGGYHKNIDDKHRDSYGDHHEDRVAHGGLDAIAGIFFELEILGQLKQDFLHRAGRFPDLHHAYVEARKYFRVALECRGKLETGIERFDEIINHARERRIVRGIAQTAQRLHDRNTGLKERVELAAEKNEIDEIDLVAAKPTLKN